MSRFAKAENFRILTALFIVGGVVRNSLEDRGFYLKQTSISIWVLILSVIVDLVFAYVFNVFGVLLVNLAIGYGGIQQNIGNVARGILLKSVAIPSVIVLNLFVPELMSLAFYVLVSIISCLYMRYFISVDSFSIDRLSLNVLSREPQQFITLFLFGGAEIGDLFLIKKLAGLLAIIPSSYSAIYWREIQENKRPIGQNKVLVVCLILLILAFVIWLETERNLGLILYVIALVLNIALMHEFFIVNMDLGGRVLGASSVCSLLLILMFQNKLSFYYAEVILILVPLVYTLYRYKKK